MPTLLSVSTFTHNPWPDESVLSRLKKQRFVFQSSSPRPKLVWEDGPPKRGIAPMRVHQNLRCFRRPPPHPPALLPHEARGRREPRRCIDTIAAKEGKEESVATKISEKPTAKKSSTPDFQSRFHAPISTSARMRKTSHPMNVVAV